MLIVYRMLLVTGLAVLAAMAYAVSNKQFDKYFAEHYPVPARSR